VKVEDVMKRVLGLYPHARLAWLFVRSWALFDTLPATTIDVVEGIADYYDGTLPETALLSKLSLAMYPRPALVASPEAHVLKVLVNWIRGPRAHRTDWGPKVVEEFWSFAPRLPGYKTEFYDRVWDGLYEIYRVMRPFPVAKRMDKVKELVFNMPVHLDKRWHTPTVKNVAKAIYNDRAFNEMAIVADALEDAGCDDKGLLAHCRRPKHIRGCYVLDALRTL
jgi:hypothetical protein